MDIVTTGGAAIPAAGRWNRDMSEETDLLIRLVDELVVVHNARLRAEDHLSILRAREASAAKKVERQREKMTVPDATIPGCRV